MKINLDSPVIVFLTTVADFMMLNILFILCCAPVITIGPAVSALYTITMRESCLDSRIVLFTRLLCARQDMRVDIYSNLFSKHLKIISSRRFSYPSCI